MKRQILEELTITEISGVDRPCQEHAKVAIMKRDFSSKQRDKLANTGAAMPDGSYPIVTEGDLHNAIQAYGRSNNPAATKRHIMRRAKALGCTDQLPEGWMSKQLDDRVEALKKNVAALDPEIHKFWSVAARLAAIAARRLLMRGSAALSRRGRKVVVGGAKRFAAHEVHHAGKSAARGAFWGTAGLAATSSAEAAQERVKNLLEERRKKKEAASRKFKLGASS